MIYVNDVISIYILLQILLILLLVKPMTCRICLVQGEGDIDLRP